MLRHRLAASFPQKACTRPIRPHHPRLMLANVQHGVVLRSVPARSRLQVSQHPKAVPLPHASAAQLSGRHLEQTCSCMNCCVQHGHSWPRATLHVRWAHGSRSSLQKKHYSTTHQRPISRKQYIAWALKLREHMPILQPQGDLAPATSLTGRIGAACPHRFDTFGIGGICIIDTGMTQISSSRHAPGNTQCQGLRGISAM